MEYSLDITEIVNFTKKTWNGIAIILYWFLFLYEHTIYLAKNYLMA